MSQTEIPCEGHTSFEEDAAVEELFKGATLWGCADEKASFDTRPSGSTKFEEDPLVRELFKRAIIRGDVETVTAMLVHNADPNFAYDLGLTPLHLAALHDRLAVVDALLAAGADVSATTADEVRLTARAIAEIQGHTEVLEAILQASEGMPSSVRLNIYDVGAYKGFHVLNDVFRVIGTGAFHAGVEVYGREVSFGHVEYTNTGIFTCEPRGCETHTFRESVEMGETTLSEQAIQRILQEMEIDWQGPTYDLLQRNCCHFSNSFCIRLGVGPIPEWVTSLAGVGATLNYGVKSVASAAQKAAIVAAAKAGTVDQHLDISNTVAMSTRYNLRMLRELNDSILETVSMSADYNQRQMRAIRQSVAETMATAYVKPKDSRQLIGVGGMLKVRDPPHKLGRPEKPKANEPFTFSETVAMSAAYNRRQIAGLLTKVFGR